MKRDLDLLRNILLGIENHSGPRRLSVDSFISGVHAAEEISGHIKLLLDAGYIDAVPYTYISQSVDDFHVKRITMQGYDYLDSVRDDKVWDETKKRISSSVASASLEIVKAVATSITVKMLGI